MSIAYKRGWGSYSIWTTPTEDSIYTGYLGYGWGSYSIWTTSTPTEDSIYACYLCGYSLIGLDEWSISLGWYSSKRCSTANYSSISISSGR